MHMYIYYIDCMFCVCYYIAIIVFIKQVQVLQVRLVRFESGILSPVFGRQQTDKTPDKRWTSVCTANE
jgi:hypothetical protein